MDEYILPVRFDNTEIPGIKKTMGYIDIKSLEPNEIANLIARKINPNIDLDHMLKYLEEWLSNYEINISGDMVVFHCEVEDYHNEYPINILLEMYRKDQLDELFLLPAIVPW